MNLTISLHEFLELITYNQLFDHVVIPNSIGDAIENALIEHHKEMSQKGILINLILPCHVERTDLGYCNVWYPIGSWNAELTRRSDLEKILLENKRNPQKITLKSSTAISGPSDLQSQLIDATMKNDTALVAYLLQQIAEGK